MAPSDRRTAELLLTICPAHWYHELRQRYDWNPTPRHWSLPMPNAPSVRKLAALFCLVWLASIPGDLLAQTKPQRTDVGGEAPSSFLWVGNSFFYYNNSMHSHVGSLARAAKPPDTYRAVSVTISGSGMDWHDMASYFRPHGIGRYSLVGAHDVALNQPGKQVDAAVTVDGNQCPIQPQLKSEFPEAATEQSHIGV